MYDLITINNAVTFKNEALNHATQQIFSIAENMRKGALETAFLINYVAEAKAFAEDGFKTVHDWTETTFGLQKSQSYNLAKVGRDWTVMVTDEKGNVKGFASKLYALTDMKHGDFNSTQLIILSTLKYDTVADLVKKGTVTPATSCAELREIVKRVQKPDSNQTENGETNGTATGGKVVATVSETVTLKDENGLLYEIPLKVAEKYKVVIKVEKDGTTVKTVGGKVTETLPPKTAKKTVKAERTKPVTTAKKTAKVAKKTAKK